MTMKAVANVTSFPIVAPGLAINIILPAPVPNGYDVPVKLHAVSVNPVDRGLRAAEVNGLEWAAAGVVRAVDGQSTLFKPGPTRQHS